MWQCSLTFFKWCWRNCEVILQSKTSSTLFQVDLSNQWFFDYRSLWKNLSTMRHGSYNEMTTNLRSSDSGARAHDLSNQWFFDYRSLWKNLPTMPDGSFNEMTTILRLSDSGSRAMAVWFISKECEYPCHSSVVCTNIMIKSIGQPFYFSAASK